MAAPWPRPMPSSAVMNRPKVIAFSTALSGSNGWPARDVRGREATRHPERQDSAGACSANSQGHDSTDIIAGHRRARAIRHRRRWAPVPYPAATRRSRSRAPSAAPAARPRTRCSGWSRRCSSLDELPRPDHAADALAVAICHANGAPLRRGAGGRDDRAARRRGRGPARRPRRRLAAAASATGSRSRPRRCATSPRWASRPRSTRT